MNVLLQNLTDKVLELTDQFNEMNILMEQLLNNDVHISTIEPPEQSSHISVNNPVTTEHICT